MTSMRILPSSFTHRIFSFFFFLAEHPVCLFSSYLSKDVPSSHFITYAFDAGPGQEREKKLPTDIITPVMAYKKLLKVQK